MSTTNSDTETMRICTEITNVTDIRQIGVRAEAVKEEFDIVLAELMKEATTCLSWYAAADYGSVGLSAGFVHMNESCPVGKPANGTQLREALTEIEAALPEAYAFAEKAAAEDADGGIAGFTK